MRIGEKKLEEKKLALIERWVTYGDFRVRRFKHTDSLLARTIKKRLNYRMWYKKVLKEELYHGHSKGDLGFKVLTPPRIDAYMSKYKFSVTFIYILCLK